VCLKFRAASEQHDVAYSERVPGDGFHVHYFSIVDRRQHATTDGLEAKSEAAGDQLAGEQMKDRRLRALVSHDALNPSTAATELLSGTNSNS